MKGIILKAVTTIMLLIAIVSTCALDSESIIPSITLIVSMIWLFLFVLANCEEDY